MNAENEKIIEGMKLTTVIPLAKGNWKEELTYFTSKKVAVGQLVDISIRQRKILGLVTTVEDVSFSKGKIKKMPFDLKKILDVKEQTIFKEEYLEAAFLTAEYFLQKKNSVLTSLLPAAFRENYDQLLAWKKNQKTETKTIIKNLKTEKLLFQNTLTDRVSYYKTLIRGHFAEKKSVAIILPTEKDINLFFNLVAKGIEKFTFCLNGEISAKKQIEAFQKIVSSEHPVLILATAPFLSIPREDLKTIVLEHESANAYRANYQPADWRILVEIYATKIGAKLILADNLLRLETIARIELDNLNELYPLYYRINFEGKIILAKEENEESTDKKFEIFSGLMIEQIEKTLNRKQNVFVFSPRKGLATITICRDCQKIIECDNCFTPLTLYLSKDQQKRMFVCNKCKLEKDPQITCSNCQSWNLMPLGIGTDTVIQELSQKIKKYKIFKLDKNIAKSVQAAQNIVKEFENKSKSVLVGTEMAFHYLNEKVSLSLIPSLDSLWSIPNYKMTEKVLQIFFNLINQTKDRIILQVKNESSSFLEAIEHENILPLVREELNDRKKLNYPPFIRFIKITFAGDKKETIQAREFLKKNFEEYQPEIFSGFVEKTKGQYITNALLKIKPENWSVPELKENSVLLPDLYQKLSELIPTFSVQIDPEDLL